MNRGADSLSEDCSFPVWVAGERAERCFKRSWEAFISRQFTVVISSFLSELCGQHLLASCSAPLLEAAVPHCYTPTQRWDLQSPDKAKQGWQQHSKVCNSLYISTEFAQRSGDFVQMLLSSLPGTLARCFIAWEDALHPKSAAGSPHPGRAQLKGRLQ